MEDVETYLLLHEAGETGEDIDDVRDRLGAREVRRRAVAYRRTWLERGRTSRASSRPGTSISAAVETDGLARAAAGNPETSHYATLSAELGRTLDSFRRQLSVTDSTGLTLSARTTRVAADTVIRLLGARVIVGTVPAQEKAGLFSLEVLAADRLEVIELLIELSGGVA